MLKQYHLFLFLISCLLVQQLTAGFSSSFGRVLQRKSFINKQSSCSSLSLAGNRVRPAETPRVLLSSPPVLTASTNEGGTSSFCSSVINLSKTIIGAGVLSLPYGIASFTDTTQSLTPAISLAVIMGIISAYSFYCIGKVCDYYKVNNFSKAWEKTVGGGSSKKGLEFVLLFKTFFSCLTYSIIIGKRVLL
jgi:hypothetical protein